MALPIQAAQYTEADAVAAAEAVIAAREMRDRAEAVVKDQEARFIAVLEGSDVEGTFVKVAETPVGIVEGERRTADAGIAKKLLVAETYEAVTKSEIVLRKLDAAVTLGSVTPEQADQIITKRTPYKTVRVG